LGGFGGLFPLPRLDVVGAASAADAMTAAATTAARAEIAFMNSGPFWLTNLPRPDPRLGMHQIRALGL
jgi:hypothetical protein